MRPWHDFHIVGYAVDGIRREVAFDLAWPYETPVEIRGARIVFIGVEAYFLEHDLGSNIVYDFAERPLKEFLEEWMARFEVNAKYGWPAFWRPKPYPPRPVDVELEDTFQLLSERGVKCIELASSYGLSGWVLAASVQEDVGGA